MKKITKLFLIISLTGLIACHETPKEPAKTSPSASANESTSPKTDVNVDPMVQLIDQTRAQIESNLGQPTEVSTAKLKEKIKQKWSKIHFYTQNGQVVRIKAYPYDQISKRTEEFYLQGDKLILALIQDDGISGKEENGETGEKAETINKMYYFQGDELIKEIKQANEEEHSIKNSDAEELIQEVNEYLEIFAQEAKK
jgi:hypothetical protein